MDAPLSPEESRTTAWHALPADDAAENLASPEAGLTDEEVARRRGTFGENALPQKRPPTVFEVFLRQFTSPLIYVLLAAGIISVLFADFTDAVFIFIVILINAVIGTFQEVKAERSATALQQMLKIHARVRRDGREATVPAEDLVPGDRVVLVSGDRVPADVRVIRAQSLAVDESLLTGESHAVGKNTDPVDVSLPLGDRQSMLYAGSTVMTGRSIGVVVATGQNTEIGQIAETVTASEAGKPPLVIRMEDFSKKISIAVLAATGVLAIIVLGQGVPPIEVFFLAVALAVSAIPEGLPIALTVALSIAASRMAGRNVIVRFLAAVESLGSCTLIASDKTGTLTVNQQTARVVALPTGEMFSVTGAGYAGEGEILDESGTAVAGSVRDRIESLARAATISNEATLERNDGGDWTHRGDAIDVAFLALTYKLGLDPAGIRESAPSVAEIPFESERRYAAVWYREGEETLVAVKGAIETVLPFCRTMAAGPGRSMPLDPDRVQEELDSLTSRGYRVLAVAHGRAEGGVSAENPEVPPLELLGLVGFIDPIRPDVPDAVRRCRDAGVDVVMVTGDHPATAFAIARELKITDSPDRVVTGAELGDEEIPTFTEFIDRVQGARVFARVTPLQKLRIVEAYRESGAYVAVTGDGVNDAPALRSANIGVAMGSGTDVAKDTASLIVTDDDFASIVAGIEEGRYAYDNVRKVVYLLISTGFAEVLLFMLALLIGLPLPILAVQLLWLNLVTNGIQDVALAFEGGEPGVMKRPPRRPEEGIFNRLMMEEVLLSGTVIALVALGAWHWLISNGWDEFAARNLLVLLMVLFENFHAFNCRSEYLSAFRVPISRNYFLVAGVIAAQGIHILALYVPFLQDVLQLQPVSLVEWLSLLALASSVVIVMEVFKAVRRHRPPVHRTGTGVGEAPHR
ncbi:HAD-IC family P-type ATPase [Methanoculleus sp. MH98A]|uniref:cation-translocating P-type ATPase n=1 Tax=Methanoculleus sp. MH98A TaxID=1495314 RepID=UPI00049F6C02|nr:HAD-IC family P-type ATPase [Methanoculleus sp. MH98A]KDE56567.1 ATPase [Methanoculleus sp. MH98A]